jgi:hypothetical protein
MSAARVTAAAAFQRANAELQRKLAKSLAERDEALEYQTATALHALPLDGGGSGRGCAAQEDAW